MQSGAVMEHTDFIVHLGGTGVSGMQMLTREVCSGA